MLNFINQNTLERIFLLFFLIIKVEFIDIDFGTIAGKFSITCCVFRLLPRFLNDRINQCDTYFMIGGSIAFNFIENIFYILWSNSVQVEKNLSFGFIDFVEFIFLFGLLVCKISFCFFLKNIFK